MSIKQIYIQQQHTHILARIPGEERASIPTKLTLAELALQRKHAKNNMEKQLRVSDLALLLFS